MRRITRYLAVGAVALGASCADAGKLLEPRLDGPESPSFAISGGSFVTGHNGTNSNSSFITLTAPAVGKGDLLLAQITRSKDFTSSDATCAPAGWTSLIKHDYERKVVQEIYSYVAPEDAGATAHTWHFKTSAGACGTSGSARTGKGATGGIVHYTGVDPLSPIAAVAGRKASGSSTTATAPSVTTTVDGTQVVRFFSAFKNTSFGNPTAQRLYTLGSSNNSSERAAAAYHENQTSAGAAGTFNARLASSAEWVAATIALTPAAYVTVNKVVVNEADGADEDDGLFDLQIGGTTYASDVGNGGSTGAIVVQPGSISVGELAGTGTNLADYSTQISCDNDSDGSFTIAYGEMVTCTITNTRLATLTVNKVVDPDDDDGLFNLLIDDEVEAEDVGHGGSTGAVRLAAGTYTVSESAGTGTDLADYDIEIGGDCDEYGEITLVTGQNATCTITNTRKVAEPSGIVLESNIGGGEPQTTYTSGGNSEVSSSLTLKITAPAGELLLAHVAFEKGSDAGSNALITPSGWTLVRRTNSGSDIGSAVFWRISAGGETTVTFNFNQSVKHAGAILRYSGVDQTTPILVHSGGSGSSGSLTAPDPGAAVDGSVVVSFFTLKKASGATLNAPAVMTQRYQFANPQDVRIMGADQLVSAGTVGSRTATVSGSSDKWVAQTVVLRPAP